ncbi:MAG: ABC transporter permease [Chloroflexota bacterium]|nr:ABC transporter permease [Chloroflexota bacterium]
MTTTLTQTATAAALPPFSGLQRFGLLMRTNARLFVRNRTALFWNIAFPIALMLLFGSMYGSQPGAVAYLTTGMVVLSLMSNGITGNAATLATWRERGILRRIQTTPLPVWQLLLARIVTHSVIMVAQAGLLIGTSVLVFGVSYEWGNVILSIPVLILGALLFMTIGQMMAALVQKAETVTVVTQVVYFPLMFLGNIVITSNNMPSFLQTIGKWLPSTMVADLVRTVMLGLNSDTAGAPLVVQPLAIDLAGSALYFVVALVISVRFFKWR